MTARIEQIFIAPVKSLGLAALTRARLTKAGIAGDRAFYIIDADGKLVTQRQHGALVQVGATHNAASGTLSLTFPDGRVAAGVPEAQGRVTTPFFGARTVEGELAPGEWDEALSAFAGQPLRLVRAAPGASFDAFPVSLCSAASLQALARAAGADAVDGRRFRQNLYVSGTAAHGEDDWLGSEVRAGAAVLRVKMRDPRCVMTTHNPDTGATDLNTLKIIASYRTDQPKEANFGVYCTVTQAGEVAIGDEIAPLS